MAKFLLLLLCVFSSASAEVFKCKNGSAVTYSEKPCGVGAVAYESRLSSASGASGSLSVSRSQNGTYYIPGVVNGYPVDFIIDTGASYTVLQGDLAYRMGIKSCAVAGVANTANGEAGYCLVRLSRLSFGSFVFSDVTVAVQPGLTGRSLLGNDVLKHFTIHQSGDLLTLSR